MATWRWIKERNLDVWSALPPLEITGYEDLGGMAFITSGTVAGLELRILPGEFWFEPDPQYSLCTTRIPAREGQQVKAAMRKGGRLRTKAEDWFAAQLAFVESTDARQRSAQLSRKWWDAL